MIKKLSFVLGLWAFVVSFMPSCSKDGNPVTPELVVSTEKITLSNAGEMKAFHVKSNVVWSATSSESWLTISPGSGGNATVKVEATAGANPQTADRQAVITITANGLNKQIEVVQTASSMFSVVEHEYTLDMSEQDLVFTVQSNKAYSIAFDDDWISRKSEPVVTGNSYQETLSIKVNRNLFKRTGIVTLKQGDETLVISIQQDENLLKIDAVSSGVSSNAAALAAKLRVGWNLGNALEAAASTNSADETLWGNPKTSKALIDAVKAAGFNAVRIPCAWSGYIEDRTTHKIKDAWLERVKEVVDYCVDNDMYAIINIHWDGGWLEEHPLYSHQEEVNSKQKALWEQIAVYFRDYDEHLLFAGTNEVRANYNTPTTENNTVQQSYNQTFVSAVRSTGGRNAYRNLIIQSYNTNIQFALDFLKMPTDEVSDRMMAEVHFYDPWDFCGEEGSNKYFWGKEFEGRPNISDWGQEDWVDERFAAMKTNFVNKGIPVILGEYGAIWRSGLTGLALQDHQKARNHYLAYVTKAAKNNGLIPFYWDNGHIGENGFGLFNRNTFQPVNQDAIDAIMSGVQ